MYTGMSSECQERLASGSWTMKPHVIITSAGGSILNDLPISAGLVTSDATSQVRRTATLTADPKYWPSSPADLLAPYGSKASIFYSVKLSRGRWEDVPLGVFYLDEGSRARPYSSGSGVTVTLSDASSRVAESRLTAPLQTAVGVLVVNQIKALVQGALPAVGYTDLTGSTQVLPQVIIDKERWADGIEAFSDSIGAETFFDVFGNAVTRLTPTLANTPVWTLYIGDRGNIVTDTDDLSRANVFNQWVISSAPADGTTAPISVVVQDTNPASPTYVGGPFGIRTRYYSTANATTSPQLTAIGQSFLSRFDGFAIVPQYTTLVNPALEAGDVLPVVVGESNSDPFTTIILDTVTVPLTPGDLQTLTARANQLPEES